MALSAPVGSVASAAEAASTVQRLGALTLPVVMANARALLLASKVFSLPAELSQSLWSQTVEGGGHLLDGQACWHPSSLSPFAALLACKTGVQLIRGLLPHLPPVQLRQKGSDSTWTAPALLPGGLQKLLRQADACTAALQDAKLGLAAGKAKLGNMSLGCSDTKLAELSTPAAPSHNDTDTPCNDQSCSTAASSSNAPSLLRTFALSMLSHLPSAKVCCNPECVVLAELSERELCVRQCGACGMTTAYCSKSCIQAHGQSHKRLCKRLAAAGTKAAAAAVDIAGN